MSKQAARTDSTDGDSPTGSNNLANAQACTDSHRIEHCKEDPDLTRLDSVSNEKAWSGDSPIPTEKGNITNVLLLSNAKYKNVYCRR